MWPLIIASAITPTLAGVSEPTVAELHKQLDELTIRDAARLGRRLKNLRGAKPDRLARLAEQIAAGRALVATRQAAVPTVTYPDLPVSEHRDELAAAIREHQVVVVAGATGSGKTTQLPKICLELGRGIRGTIGHTQPRRLAARTVAQRIADELHTPLGEAVGYTVRFTDQASDRTLVKLMTDGILLAEIQRDRRLLRYDTLILDEAHERSLNIDFLLGYLRELLPRRPDLKVIVTSATIEPERFAAHFSGAPIVEVSGRTYPVEIRYRPLEVAVAGDVDDDDPDDPDHEIVRTEMRDQTEAIVDAIAELEKEPPGDVLVFLSGEREIRDTAEALKGRKHTEVLPLYARLPTAEQQKVFQPHTGRRVVLATNVAETSLTVPGVRYVVDPGTARISRYSRRTKVQRLPIEPISQASAAQRAGRSGRVAPGVCIRLYSEDDFESRPRFTDPEILRTNLAAVILQMAALQLGDIEDFGFLDPPDKRSIRDGVLLLQELGAFDRDGKITELGRRLARLPVDPRLGRMILQADAEGCVREVLVLAAALSIPDPRERPADREETARQKHARFADERSDFISYLNLWRYLRDQRKERSGNAFRRMCREEFLHYLRIREWQDLTGQLRSIARDIGIRESDEEADPARIHAALTAGLLSHIGLRDETKGRESREFQGARNTKFVLAPGSVLTKRAPRWVVVAELVETSRLYGRIAARIEPEGVERISAHLVQRTYSEPHWDAPRGAVMAYERVTLYGLPLVPRRHVNYAQVEPELARELFIRHALVEGDWQTRHHFFRDNARMREELEEIEERARRRDLIVGGDEFAWHVPALREELVTALIRSLPKDLRRNFVPAPDTARAVLATLEPGTEPLLQSLQRALQRRTGVLVPIDAFDIAKLPSHLRVTFAVESPDGTEVARGKDLEVLQEQLAAPARQAVAEAVADGLRRSGLRTWPDDLEELPRTVERVSGGHTVRGFPAFVDAGSAVDVRVFATEAEQDAAMGSGILRLLRLTVPSPVKAIERQLNPRTRLVLGANPDGSLAALLDDCADAAVAVLAPAPVWRSSEFSALRQRVADALTPTTIDIVARVEKVLAAAHEVEVALPAAPAASQTEAVADIRAQLDQLLPYGFVTATGATRLGDLTRYLTAAGRRLERLPQGINADRERMSRVHAVQDVYDELRQALSPIRAAADDVRDIARMIEELRVSLWAQQLGTARPVSEQRIYRAIDAIIP